MPGSCPPSSWRTWAKWVAMLSFCLVRSSTSRCADAERRRAAAQREVDDLTGRRTASPPNSAQVRQLLGGSCLAWTWRCRQLPAEQLAHLGQVGGDAAPRLGQVVDLARPRSARSTT